MGVFFRPGGTTQGIDSAVLPATSYQAPHAGASGRSDSPVRPSGLVYETAKRVVDVALGSVAVALGAPLFLLVALMVRLSGRGPVIFWQRRLGRGGRVFWCGKFRTMVVDAEERLTRSAELLRRFEEDFKIKDDPRITPVGRFLRKTSLDELPQIFNVLRGEISLIGPRPVVPHELVKYGAYADKLLSVPQGLSGYWQVYGRSDTTYEDRIRMDMCYIDNRSLWLDLRLIGMTFVEVLRGRGAY